MLVPHFFENIFQSGFTHVSSWDCFCQEDHHLILEIDYFKFWLLWRIFSGTKFYTYPRRETTLSVIDQIKVASRGAGVHLNCWAKSTFPVPVCTVPSSMDRISRCYKVDAVRLYASFRLNLLLLKGQRCL